MQKEYNRIISGAKNSHKAIKNAPEHFIFMVTRESPKEYLFTLVGKHYSTNKLNTISFREKMKYILSITENHFVRVISFVVMIVKNILFLVRLHIIKMDYTYATPVVTNKLHNLGLLNLKNTTK